MIFNKNFIIVIAVLVSSCFLSQCARVPNIPYFSGHIVSPYTQSAKTYFELASQSEGEKKNQYLLMAAGRLVEDRAWNTSTRLLLKLNHLTKQQTNERQILLAQIYSLKKNPGLVINSLAQASEIDQATVYNQIQYHQLLATAYFDNGRFVNSIYERIKLDALLSSNQTRTANARDLWRTLLKLPTAELNTLKVEHSDLYALSGWVELALLERKTGKSGYLLSKEIQVWQTQSPNHPANLLLNGVDQNQLIDKKNYKIGLFLPLTGSLSGPGGAVLDGFNRGRQGDNSAVSNVGLYDTNKYPVHELYKQAMIDGVDVIVGPLSKKNSQLLVGTHPKVPTIVLSDVVSRLSGNTFELALSSEREAEYIADEMRARFLSRSLIIAPKGEWGDQVIKAFHSKWYALGGKVIDTWRYSPQEDVQAALRDFLHVQSSEERSRGVKRVLGRKIESQIRRRQDFDSIFLLAYPSKARQIVPMLRYYYAGNVPIFATSNLYNGANTSMKNKDLDGVIFCDLAFVSQLSFSERNWPEYYNNYSRLYALGVDAYTAAANYNRLVLFPAIETKNQGGVLFLKNDHVIEQNLVWMTFKQGIAKRW